MLPGFGLSVGSGRLPRGGSLVFGAQTYAVQLVRTDGGSGSCLVEAGFPLKPGLLQPSEANLVTLWIGGVEQTVYTEMLEGTHPDGSARAVFIQTTQSVSDGSPVSATLKIGQEQTQTTTKTTTYKRLLFTSGGTGSISDGQTIVGDTSGATADVAYHNFQNAGSVGFPQGTMKGYLYLENQSGTFQSENISISGGQSNIATISGDSEDCVLTHDREAVIVCTDEDYLVQWECLGPLITYANYPAGDAQTFETNWESRMDTWYSTGPSSWPAWSNLTHVNFYDRVWNHYQKWSICGETKWFVRAIEHSVWWHDQASNDLEQTWHHMYQGSWATYLLTGGMEFFDQLILVAEYWPGTLEPASDYHADYPGGTEGRTMAYLTRDALIGHLLGNTFKTWTDELSIWLDKIQIMQETDGSFDEAYDHLGPTAPQKNYMGGMVCDTWIWVLDVASETMDAGEEQDIEDLIKLWIDFQWDDATRSQWDADSETFQYEVEVSEHVDNPYTGELNGLQIHGYAYIYEKTGLSAYKTRAEAILSGICGPYMTWGTNQKFVNQAAFGTRNAIARIYGS